MSLSLVVAHVTIVTMVIIPVVVTVVISVSIVIIVIIVVVTIYATKMRRVSESVRIFFFLISEYGMTESSNSTDCVMCNSSYSSDSVVNKSKDEVSVVVIYFKSIFYKFVHNFVCHIINFFISKYGMAESSNSTDCVMSNSSYSSDSVVNKSKDEISFSFAVFSLENVLYHLFG